MSQTATSTREYKLKQLRELKLQASIRRGCKSLLQPILHTSLLVHNSEMDRLINILPKSTISNSIEINSAFVVLTEGSQSSRNDEMSVRSDMTSWGNYNTLQDELSRKKRDTEKAMRRFFIAKTELGKGKTYTETARVDKLEEELKSLRIQARNHQKLKDHEELSSKKHKFIAVKNEELIVLNTELNSLYEENRSYSEHLNNLKQEHTKFLKQSKSSFQTLSEEIEKLRNRPVRSSQNNQEMQAAEVERERIKSELDYELAEVNSLHNVIQQKDETIDELDKNLDIIQKRNESLLETLNANYLQFSQPAEQSSLCMPIVNIYPQANYITLLADVGSTGACIEREEEQKETHMASPDPFENLLHQATGETVHHHNEDIEAATPPIDQPWVSSVPSPGLQNESRPPPESLQSFRGEEESKGQVTPKQKEGLSRTSSRSSTPPRNIYERSSPDPQQPASQRVHNLIQPQNPRLYSIPSNPFSRNQESENDDFFSQMIKESKKIKKLPQSFFE